MEGWGRGGRALSGPDGQAALNDWTAICGYRNQKGEIDVILVGPQGAVAVEIKNYFGRIRCSGDTFWRTARGEDKRMEDRGSRSPSQQVNQATDELQRSLGLHKVARAVVFTHRGAYVQSVNSPTVEYVGVLTDFRPADLPASEPQHWDEARRQSTLDSLAEDHRRHNQHRPTLTASRLPSFVTVRSLMSEYRRALAAVCVFCLVCFCVGAATLVRRAAGPTHSSAPIVEGTQPSGKIAADGVPRALQQAVGEWASRRKALRRLDRFVIVAMQPQGTATSSSALVVTTSWQRANVAGSTRLLLHVSQHRGRWRIDTVRNMEGSELRLP